MDRSQSDKHGCSGDGHQRRSAASPDAPSKKRRAYAVMTRPVSSPRADGRALTLFAAARISSTFEKGKPSSAVSAAGTGTNPFFSTRHQPAARRLRAPWEIQAQGLFKATKVPRACYESPNPVRPRRTHPQNVQAHLLRIQLFSLAERSAVHGPPPPSPFLACPENKDCRSASFQAQSGQLPPRLPRRPRDIRTASRA